MKDIFRHIIPKYLSYNDCSNFSILNKETYSFLKETLEKKKLEIQKDVMSLFPIKIIDMIGRKNFLKSKRINWDDKYLGSTGYLDGTFYVQFGENENVYYGKDCYNRSFIFAKVKIFHENETENETENKTETTTISIFQRYTENMTLYVAVEPKGRIWEFFGGDVTINERLWKKLKDVFHSSYDVKNHEHSFLDMREYVVQLN